MRCKVTSCYAAEFLLTLYFGKHPSSQNQLTAWSYLGWQAVPSLKNRLGLFLLIMSSIMIMLPSKINWWRREIWCPCRRVHGSLDLWSVGKSSWIWHPLEWWHLVIKKRSITFLTTSFRWKQFPVKYQQGKEMRPGLTTKRLVTTMGQYLRSKKPFKLIAPNIAFSRSHIFSPIPLLCSWWDWALSHSWASSLVSPK